jgi:hypothetical protein
MRRLILGVLIVGMGLWSFVSCAEDIRQEVVASTLVTGSVQITPEGKVHSYTVDQADKLPAAARELLDKNIPAWTFQRNVTLPVDITERMTIRLRVAPVDDKHDTISIVAASFDDDFQSSDETATAAKRTQPAYPRMSMDARVGGTVYVLILVGRDGRSQKVLTEQVNLRAAVPKYDQERFRNDLAGAAIRALSSWTWTVPSSGRWANSPGWWVRVPVRFNIHVMGTPPPQDPGYGDWDVYIPGPRRQLTSVEAGPDMRAEGSDAMVDGSIHFASSSVTLKTPLGGS